MTGQWVRWVGPGRRNCKLGCGPIFRVMWAVSRPLAEIRFLLNGSPAACSGDSRSVLASPFDKKPSHPNHPLIRFLTHRPRHAKTTLRRLDNYVPVHSLQNHLPASSTAGSARGAAPLVFRPSWSPPLPPPCCEYLDGPSHSPRSNVLTVFHAATRPSRVLIIPQTTTTSLKKSQSTMYNSTGPSASGRYAHPPRPSSRPRDPKIAILTTPIGLVPLDAKRRPGDGNPELRHA